MYGLPYYERGIRAMHSEVAPYITTCDLGGFKYVVNTVCCINLPAAQSCNLFMRKVIFLPLKEATCIVHDF